MRTSRKTDFRKLKITLVASTYPGQRPQCPSLSPHVLLSKTDIFKKYLRSLKKEKEENKTLVTEKKTNFLLAVICAIYEIRSRYLG